MSKVSVALDRADISDVVTALRLAADAAEALSRVGAPSSQETGRDPALATLSRRYRKLARRLAGTADRGPPPQPRSARKPPEGPSPVRVASEESARERARLEDLLRQKRAALINLGVFPGHSPVRERLKDGLRIGIEELEALLGTPRRG